MLRDASDWDEVVARLGYEHLRRHSLRHTGLTWMADAGVTSALSCTFDCRDERF
jgi:hypothetical protein